MTGRRVDKLVRAGLELFLLIVYTKYVCVCTHLCMRVCMCVRVYACVCMRVNVRVCVCVSACGGGRGGGSVCHYVITNISAG